MNGVNFSPAVFRRINWFSVIERKEINLFNITICYFNVVVFKISFKMS